MIILIQDHCALIGTWRTTQENSTTTRTKRALVLAEKLGTLAWGDLT
jgi:hypothetical protein